MTSSKCSLQFAKIFSFFVINFSLILSAPAYAVRDYSLAAQLAMYDSIEETCRPLVPSLFDEVKKNLIYLDPEKTLEIIEARRSTEYFEVLDLARKTMFKPTVRGSVAEAAECKKYLEGYRRIPD